MINSWIWTSLERKQINFCYFVLDVWPGVSQHNPNPNTLNMLSVVHLFLPSLVQTQIFNNSLTCKTCKDVKELESQEHLLYCKEIKKHVEIPPNMKYSDVFSHVDKQFEIVQVFKKIERQREIILICTSSLKNVFSSSSLMALFWLRKFMEAASWSQYFILLQFVRINIYIPIAGSQATDTDERKKKPTCADHLQELYFLCTEHLKNSVVFSFSKLYFF